MPGKLSGGRLAPQSDDRMHPIGTTQASPTPGLSRRGGGVGPQEAARIAKLKVEAVKVVSSILPTKLNFQRLRDDPNFTKLPKPLASKLLDAGKTLCEMSDQDDARAAGKITPSLPFEPADVKEAIQVCTL